ncbi:LLM class flavin-dependent oxidoreductase [Micromonospora andamanensis]|uniref:N5,N10-methylene tetrahydromethanopterin reductase n=1 Tax=Micromonospora andamanensis TaxID=1287068 RepID=A0ABQ4HYZ3_9ACTN|nr:LLM class flavin-dependent oxidoreductase [Micromonospora andamanensis]GIJ10888.1 N5,N10-methylene tetrahydromethanopterin reductase [Micromonospora andamanensis]
MSASDRLVGIGLQSDKSADEYAVLAEMAERHGFDVLSVFGDLMYQPPLFPLLVAARHTRRIRLGAACLNPFTLHPVEVAGQVAALDLASHGRAYLGLARGTWLQQVGVAQIRPLRRIAETVQIVRRLLAGDDGGFVGREFTVAPGTALRYTPARPDVPVLVGTWGQQTARSSAAFADEVKVGGSANPAMAKTMRAWLDEAASGRDTGVVLGAVTVVDTDGALARRVARTEVAMYLAVVAALDPTVEIDPELLARIQQHVTRREDDLAGALIGDDLLDLFAFSGTPEQVAAQAAAVFDAGASRVEFGTPHGLTPQRGIDLIGRRVLPLLRT